MSTLSTAFCCVLIACSVTRGDSPTKGNSLFSTEVSPSGAIKLQYYANDDNSRQIWVSDSRKPANCAMLYEYSRSAKALVSDDDRYIALTDYAGSDTASPFLFVRTSGVHYAAVTNVDIDKLVWEEVAKQYKVEAPFDHSYCEVTCWLGNSALLLHAWGHMSGEYALDTWFAVYDIRTRSIRFDLKSVNDRDVERFKKKSANTVSHGKALPRQP